MPGSMPKMRTCRPAFNLILYHSAPAFARSIAAAQYLAQLGPGSRLSGARTGAECWHSGLYVHLSGHLNQTGYSPGARGSLDVAAPRRPRRTSSPPASSPARPRARRKMCSEGFLNTHSLEATMNSKLWKGRHLVYAPDAAWRRRYERLLMTPVRMPSSAAEGQEVLYALHWEDRLRGAPADVLELLHAARRTPGPAQS